jgi:hypothetical protein
MFRNKNKKSQINFIAKRENKFLGKRNITIALLVFILGTGTYLGVKQKNKTVVSGALTTTEEGIPSWWYQKYFGASVCDNDLCKDESDPDVDKLTNEQEYFYQSSPVDEDTNDNGLKDGEDVASNYDPSKPGKTTFEEVKSDDFIIGESLIFDHEVKQLINDMTDPNKVKLPEVMTEEILVGKDDSKAALDEYRNRVNQLSEKYFNFDVENAFSTAAQTGDDDALTEIKARAIKLNSELKTVTVPPSAVQLHKYFIALMSLVPSVVTLPDASILNGDNSNFEDLWFDKTQAYLVLLQKISLENQKLKNR